MELSKYKAREIAEYLLFQCNLRAPVDLIFYHRGTEFTEFLHCFFALVTEF